MEKEDTEYSFKKKDEKLILKKDGENYKALKTFIVKIKNKEQVKKAMEVFVDTVNFDPAVFKGTIRTAKQANLREFKILWLTQLFSSGFFSQYLGFCPRNTVIYLLICEP